MAKRDDAKRGQDDMQGEKDALQGSSEGIFTVTAGTSVQDIVYNAGNGLELEFSFEDFQELDGEILDKLSRTSLLRYFQELNLYRRKMKREEHEAEFGKSGGVVEVLGRSADTRMQVHGLPDNLHPYWAMPDEVGDRKRAGYVTVDVDRFPEVRAGDAIAGTLRKLRRSDGKDDAILMACPTHDYEDRLAAPAQESQARITGIRDSLQGRMDSEVQDGIPTRHSTSSEKVRVVG